MDLEQLYTTYGKRVYNLALQYVLNVEDAEEITQDVFVTIHQKAAAFREEAAWSTWIYRITVNKSLDFMRHKSRKKRWFQRAEDIAAEPIEFFHPGAQMEDQEALAFIFTCIRQLNEQQQSALILHKIEGLSQKETAEILNISEKAVESLILRAKQNLKKMGVSEG